MFIDVFQRYLSIYDFVLQETNKGDHTSISLLDVGSNGPGFAHYNHFEKVNQYNIDIFPTPQKIQEEYPKVKFITYSGDRLPFIDGLFDIVICVDVLEHIPPGQRKNFILDVIRVSKSFVIFVFPVKSSEFWEKILSLITFRRIKFLEEHITNGLPEEKDFVDVIESDNSIGIIHESGNLNVCLWIPLKLFSSLCYRFSKENDDYIYKSFLFYRKHMAKYLNRGQCYSKTYILEKQK